MGFDSLAQTGDHKLSAGLALLGGERHELFQQFARRLFLETCLLSQVRYHLGFGHHFAHIISLLIVSCEAFGMRCMTAGVTVSNPAAAVKAIFKVFSASRPVEAEKMRSR